MSEKVNLHDSLLMALAALRTFYSLFLHYLLNGRYRQDFESASIRTHIHLYSWSLVFHIWDKPHYRNGIFADDMCKNLRNVALPGTFIPLSFFIAFGRLIVLYLFLVGYPIICFAAAIIAQKNVILEFTITRRRPRSLKEEILKVVQSLFDTFRSYLLEPEDWFSLWQLNCRFASLHAWKSSKQGSAKGYSMEDKYLFQEKADEMGVPVVPLVKLPGKQSRIVLKDRNEAGGMGIHFFDTSSGGGRWICQPALSNSTFIASLLPPDAPLSTFRIITGSRGGGLSENPDKKDVTALSCVFRAGRAGAKTDHASILFDCQGGVLGDGTTNAHWFIVGWNKLLSKWRQVNVFSFGGEYAAHPDTGKTLKGIELGDRYAAMQHLCTDAHRKMMPDVPLVGWELALTEDVEEDKETMVVLEANLSCNFFRGTFDREAYYELLNEYFMLLDTMK